MKKKLILLATLIFISCSNKNEDSYSIHFKGINEEILFIRLTGSTSFTDVIMSMGKNNYRAITKDELTELYKQYPRINKNYSGIIALDTAQLDTTINGSNIYNFPMIASNEFTFLRFETGEDNGDAYMKFTKDCVFPVIKK